MVAFVLRERFIAGVLFKPALTVFWRSSVSKRVNTAVRYYDFLKLSWPICHLRSS